MPNSPPTSKPSSATLANRKGSPEPQKEEATTDRLDHVVEANGGLQRWNELDTVSARLAQGDVTWEMVSQKGVLDDIYVTALSPSRC